MGSTPSPAGVFNHPDPGAQAAAIADHLTVVLAEALAAKGQASLAVSGGSSPGALYERLSRADLDWSKIIIALVDERWVDAAEPGSNEALVRRTLLQNRAAAARFVGLKTPAASPKDGLAEALARFEAVPRPFDGAVLGLGADGHTASWFPGAAGLSAALDPDGPPLAALTAPAEGLARPYLKRMTLTLAALRGCQAAILLLMGDDKRAALQTVLSPGPVEDKPARALFTQPDIGVSIHWAPKAPG